MKNNSQPHYQSRQLLTLLWFFLPLFTLGMLLFELRGNNFAGLPQAVAVLFAVNMLILSMFGFLSIRVVDQQLHWSFGLLGWPRWNLDLRRVTKVEICQTQWYEGKGIRFTREGMLYNAAGRMALRITTSDGNSFRLGTAEPEKLFEAIQLACKP